MTIKRLTNNDADEFVAVTRDIKIENNDIEFDWKRSELSFLVKFVGKKEDEA